MLGSLAFVPPAWAQSTTRPAVPQSHEAFEVRTQVRYLQYLPPGYESDPTNAKHGGDGRGWPLVIFLHGAGQRGTDLEVVKQGRVPPQMADEGRDFPFVLISPQCEPGGYWVAAALIQLIDQKIGSLRIDPDRVYVTGLSLGGYGTWDLIQRYGDRFAAAAPVCGGGDPNRVKRLADRRFPVWAFHGDADDAVPARRSQEMIEALHKAGDTAAKLTIYPGVGHDSWSKAYEDPELWRWLLGQKRERPTTAPPAKP